MTQANKKSIDAKVYINGKVNDMKEQFVKAPDEEARKQLIETFRETTSSDEYQEKLWIVRDDTDIVRKHAKRKKGEWLTSQEFRDAKTEFYGKDMDLEFWEEFGKLKLWERVNYIFDKFWDTDYAAGLIGDVLNPKNYYKTIPAEPELRNFEEWFKTIVIRQLLGDDKYIIEYSEDDNWEWDFYRKYWGWDVALAILKFLLESFNGKNWYSKLFHNMYTMANRGSYNVSERTIKNYLESNVEWARRIGKSLANHPTRDWSISDRDIVNLYVDRNYDEKEKPPFKKVNKKMHKYLVDWLIDKWKWKAFYESKYDDENAAMKIRVLDDIDLWDWVDVGAYIIDSMFTKCGYWMESVLFSFIGTILRMPEYHDKIVDLLYENVWKIKWLREIIWKFDYLTEVEKAKILWNTEEEDRLNREKFDSDLAKLQELWAKLWKQIVVEDVKNEIHEETEEVQEEQANDQDSEMYVLGTKRKRRGRFRKR